MKAVASLSIAAAVAAAVLLVPGRVEAQVRVARPRAVVVRPPIVVRPAATVFVGGFYFPSFYRARLYYGYPRYYGYGALYSQWPGGLYPYDLRGAVRLQVEPREAEVFIDGYFAGTVDDFDGIFQRLNIEPGEHDLLVYLPGHRTFEQRVYLQPGKTFRVRHTMVPLAPGDPQPVRPAAAPPTPGSDPRGGPPPAGARRGGPPPPSPDPRVPPPATGRDFGQLSLRVQPGDAQVVIDGEPWEGALADERLVVELGAGMHRLEIRKDGYRSYFTDITLRAGETRTLNVALTRQ